MSGGDCGAVCLLLGGQAGAAGGPPAGEGSLLCPGPICQNLPPQPPRPRIPQEGGRPPSSPGSPAGGLGVFRGSANIPKRKQRPSAFAFIAFAKKKPEFPCVFQRGPQPRSTNHPSCSGGGPLPPDTQLLQPSRLLPPARDARHELPWTTQHSQNLPLPAPGSTVKWHPTSVCAQCHTRTRGSQRRAPASADLHARMDAGTHDSSAPPTQPAG